jgi:hypothetical protein
MEGGIVQNKKPSTAASSMMEEETKNEATFMNSVSDLNHAQDDFFYKIC